VNLRHLGLVAVSLMACGKSGAVPTDGGIVEQLRACPTTGSGAMEGDVCFVVTPAETGLAADGINATVDQYALRPPSGARGVLLVHFNGSGGSPRGATGTSTGSWYGAARGAGLHVIGVSYVSDSAVGSLCQGDDACFEPTRATILTGVKQTGAAAGLPSLTTDDGAFVRVAKLLATLSLRDPDGGWERFVDASLMPDAERAIRWENVFVSGHSQGGGHAALVGKRNAVARVVMLASPCDSLRSGQGASWLNTASGYATPPATRFFGLGVTGDMTCDAFATNWAQLGMPARAQLLGSSCAGETAHSAPLRCANNAASWSELLR
jgi:hypothetical protein